MTTIAGSSTASWLASTNFTWWADAFASQQSSSLAPTSQDFLDQDSALANSLATISQNRMTGLATLATQAAQNRVQAQIKVLQDQLASSSASTPASTVLTPVG